MCERRSREVKKFFTAIPIIILLAIVGSGCTGDVYGPIDIENEVNFITPQHFGSGVYYFGASSETFGRSLNKFLSENSGLRVVAIASRNTMAYGLTEGYWVIVEEQEK